MYPIPSHLSPLHISIHILVNLWLFRNSGLKRRGRRSKAEVERLKKEEELNEEAKLDDSQYQVETNPILWTIEDVYQYMKRTQDCDMLANLLRDEVCICIFLINDFGTKLNIWISYTSY